MKHGKGHMPKKLLCMALSLSLVTGSLAPAAFAADPEAVVENVSSVGLTCESQALRLVDGRSVDVKLCLTQEDDAAS